MIFYIMHTCNAFHYCIYVLVFKFSDSVVANRFLKLTKIRYIIIM